MRCASVTCVVLLGCLVTAESGRAAPAASVVVSFKGNGNGGIPVVGLTESGRAYFTTTSAGGHHHCELIGRGAECGAAIRLLPPDAQHAGWRENAIYQFAPSPDGNLPLGSPTIGKGRTLFLTASAGGSNGHGAVVSLTPTTGQAWREQIIYNFTGTPDGAQPGGRPWLDAAGNLFIVTASGGTNGHGALVELMPPARGQSAWTEKLLYSFGSGVDEGGPSSSPQSDGAGGFYFTTGGYASNGAGGVVHLVPGQGGSAWTEAVLCFFGGNNAQQVGSFAEGGVVSDGQGNLLGVTYAGGAYGYGLVYKLSPPNGGVGLWTETVLYSFAANGDGSSPSHAPHIDGAGNLFLTTTQDNPHAEGGTVVELMPPANGQSTWTETTLYHFPGGAGGEFPFGGITVEDSGNFLIPVALGGQYSSGAVVELTGTGFVLK